MTILRKIYGVLDATDKSGLKNMLLKPIAMLLSLVYTPLLLSYLGDERYGLWATILSVISWVNYCDIGIGHGLRNLLIKELTAKQYDEAKKSVSTAYIVLTGIATAILLVLVVLSVLLDWQKLFNTTLPMQLPITISFVFIVINFILALCNTLLYALQMSENVSLRNCLVQVANIIGLFFLRWFMEPSLVWMAILFGSTSSIVYILTSVQLFRKFRYLRPNIHSFDRKKISAISNVGVKFFAIQISCLLLYSVDNLLITHYFGAEEVTPYHVAYKAFNMGFSFLSALTAPYWARTTEALAKGNIIWIRQAVKKMYVICGCFAIAYIGLTIVFEPLAKLWMGKELNYQSGLIETMCLYHILFSFVTVNTPFINGTGKINGQLIVSSLMGILSIPFSIFIGVNCNLGVVGIRLALTILMLFGAIYYPINLHSILKKEQRRIELQDRL